MRALDEGGDLHRHGADASTIAALLRHARGLLDIVENDNATDQARRSMNDARSVPAQLCGRLESPAQEVMPTGFDAN